MHCVVGRVEALKAVLKHVNGSRAEARRNDRAEARRECAAISSKSSLRICCPSATMADRKTRYIRVGLRQKVVCIDHSRLRHWLYKPRRHRAPATRWHQRTTYHQRWSAYFGAHSVILTDPDGCFKGDETTDLYSSVGTELRLVGSGAHWSSCLVENKIRLLRYSIDRIRFEDPPDSPEGWNILLSTLMNCVNNELDVSKTT